MRDAQHRHTVIGLGISDLQFVNSELRPVTLVAAGPGQLWRARRLLAGLQGLGAAVPLKQSGQPRTLEVGSLKPIPQVRLVPRV